MSDPNVVQMAAANCDDVLIWTVYCCPSDFPELFVLRPHSVRHGRALSIFWTGKTLEFIRLHLPAGMTNIGRNVADDGVIVECWI